jgi:hypothetical protein
MRPILVLLMTIVGYSSQAQAAARGDYPQVRLLMNYISQLIYENMDGIPTWSADGEKRTSFIKSQDGIVCSLTKHNYVQQTGLVNDYFCDIGRTSLSYGRLVFRGKAAEMVHSALSNTFRAGTSIVFDTSVNTLIPGIGEATIKVKEFISADIFPEIMVLSNKTYLSVPIFCSSAEKTNATDIYPYGEFFEAKRAGVLKNPNAFSCTLDLR